MYQVTFANINYLEIAEKLGVTLDDIRRSHATLWPNYVIDDEGWGYHVTPDDEVHDPDDDDLEINDDDLDRGLGDPP